MSENAEQVNKDFEDVIDSVLGGTPEGESHSPEQDNDVTDTLDAAGDVESAPDAGEKPADDSAKANVPDVTALQAEINNLNKRLHDTQSAMHKATEERSKLEKELNELKERKESEDDWFSEEDQAKSEQLEEDLKKSDEDIAQLDAEKNSINAKAAEAIWDAAAAKVIVEHPDFEEVVYGKLAPMMDESNTDPEAKRVRELYMALPDKSPASAYKFAKELEDRLLIDRDPDAYKQKLRSEIEREITGGSKDIVEGKDGLDLLNSADSGNYNPSEPSGNVLDFLPK